MNKYFEDILKKNHLRIVDSEKEEDFLGWIVIGTIKRTPGDLLDLRESRVIISTDPDSWLSEFKITWIPTADSFDVFVMVSPECPELFIVDSENTLLKIVRNLCFVEENIKEKEDMLTNLIKISAENNSNTLRILNRSNISSAPFNPLGIDTSGYKFGEIVYDNSSSSMYMYDGKGFQGIWSIGADKEQN